MMVSAAADMALQKTINRFAPVRGSLFVSSSSRLLNWSLADNGCESSYLSFLKKTLRVEL
jgi:hypothetical protein